MEISSRNKGAIVDESSLDHVRLRKVNVYRNSVIRLNSVSSATITQTHSGGPTRTSYSAAYVPCEPTTRGDEIKDSENAH